jgi:hypothetical protein
MKQSDEQYLRVIQQAWTPERDLPITTPNATHCHAPLPTQPSTRQANTRVPHPLPATPLTPSAPTHIGGIGGIGGCLLVLRLSTRQANTPPPPGTQEMLCPLSSSQVMSQSFAGDWCAEAAVV